MKAKVGAGAVMGATDIRQLPPALRDNLGERAKVAARKRVLQAAIIHERAAAVALAAAARANDARAELEAAKAALGDG